MADQEGIGPPGPDDEARANVSSGHAHHRHTNEPFHLVLAPRPSGAARAEAALGARALAWAGDPPWGVRLEAAGHQPVLCDVRRAAAWDAEAGGWAVWLATPRGPLPSGTRLAASYLPDGAAIAGRGFAPLYSEVPPRGAQPPEPKGKPKPRKRRPAGPARPVRAPAREPAPVAPGWAEVDTGHGVTWNPASRPAGDHLWRRPPDSPPADDADPGWCPEPPRGCGYHLNARGHKITCLGEDP